MENKVECFSTQLIDENGSFNSVGLEKFIQNVKLAECGLSYNVVTIIGPQSSGKSTLLNNLFHTDFEEMNYMKAISQTTKGIWIARCADIEPCTIVMDIEGSDGKERGQDNVAFEHQSALFALAVSNIVLFNLWCHDIGREHGACKPLLKTTFQVMLKSLTTPRKTTFIVIVRDKTKAPFEILDLGVREVIQKIWDSILKPEALKNALLSDYLNLQVVALSSYERDEDEFKKKVASLRQELFRSIAPDDRQTRVPGSGFSFSIQEMWENIKKKKELNLPSHRILVANTRCDQIANDNYSSFLVSKDWVELEKGVKSQYIPENGQKLSSLLNNCLSSYDNEAIDYEESVRLVKRKGLEEKLLRLVHPTHCSMLEHIRSSTLNDFKTELNDALNGGQGFSLVARDCSHKYKTLFGEKCKDVIIELANWDLTEINGKYSRDLDSHLTEVKTAKLSELAAQYEETLKQRICDSVETILERGKDDTWPRIRNLLFLETRKVISEFEHSGFEMDEQAEDMKSNLKNYARRLVEEETRQKVKIVSTRMNERFTSLFNYDVHSNPRVWAVDVDIEDIARTARSSCLELLSVLAAIRLDEKDTDTIWITPDGALDCYPAEMLTPSDTWENVPAAKTLITPIECKSLWDKFLLDTEYSILQAITVQKANKQENNYYEFARLCIACCTVFFLSRGATRSDASDAAVAAAVAVTVGLTKYAAAGTTSAAGVAAAIAGIASDAAAAATAAAGATSAAAVTALYDVLSPLVSLFLHNRGKVNPFA